jgi:hypothetical protein
MSDEQREKGVEEKKAAEPSKFRSHDDEPEVEGHLYIKAGQTEKKSDIVEKKSA